MPVCCIAIMHFIEIVLGAARTDILVLFSGCRAALLVKI